MVSQWNAQASQHLYSRIQEEKRISCKTSSNCNFEQLDYIAIGLQIFLAIGLQIFCSFLSLHSTKPNTQRDHLGLQILRKKNETQTRPKRDPNETQTTTQTRNVLQSTTPVLTCTTKYYSSTNLYYKVLLQYYKVLLQYYPVLQSTTQVLQSTTPVLPCT